MNLYWIINNLLWKDWMKEGGHGRGGVIGRVVASPVATRHTVASQPRPGARSRHGCDPVERERGQWSRSTGNFERLNDDTVKNKAAMNPANTVLCYEVVAMNLTNTVLCYEGAGRRKETTGVRSPPSRPPPDARSCPCHNRACGRVHAKTRSAVAPRLRQWLIPFLFVWTWG